MIWMRGSSAPSVSLQMTPSWLECRSAQGQEGSAERSGQTGSMGQGQLYEVQQGQMPSPALGSQQPHATLRAWGGVAGELPSGKGPWGVGRQLAEHEPAVCPGGQEGQWHPGLDQEWCGQQE